MPMLTKAERERVLGPRSGECSVCGGTRVRQYCRSCDEFFEECQCSQVSAAREASVSPLAHVGHRTYRWINGVIVAEPDFDHFST